MPPKKSVKKTKAATSPVNVERELTPEEKERVLAWRERAEKRAPAPKFKANREGGKVDLSLVQPALVGCEAMSRAAGSLDDMLPARLLEQVGAALDPACKDIVRAMDMAGAIMAGIAPRDEAEGLLAAQMVASHTAAMECIKRAHLPEQLMPARELNLRFADRFMRTYAAQLEALKKYRSGGQQHVTVEHVHVHEGGQAIVGNVATPAGSPSQGTRPEPQALDIAPEGQTLTMPGGQTAPCEALAREGGGGCR